MQHNYLDTIKPLLPAALAEEARLEVPYGKTRSGRGLLAQPDVTFDYHRWLDGFLDTHSFAARFDAWLERRLLLTHLEELPAHLFELVLAYDAAKLRGA